MYNIGRLYRTTAKVDIDRLRSAIATAATRHEPWIWTFGMPRTQLNERDAIEIEVVGAAASEPWPEPDVLARQLRPFDLDNGPLLRVAIRPNNNGTADVALFSHHISCDHQSLDVLWDDIDAYYTGRSVEPLPYTLSDLHRWQAATADQDRDYWLGVAPDWVRPPDFSTTESGAAAGVEPDGYITVPATISPAQFANTAGRSPVAATVAAAANAAQEFFDTPAINVGLVVSTRTHRAAQRLAGYLLNVVPVRVDLDRSDADMIEQASTSVGQAMVHRSYPFAKIASDARGAGHNAPSASILVSYVDDPPARFDGQTGDQRMLFNGFAVADLTFFIEPSATTLTLGLEYRGSTVGSARAARILARFNQALTRLHSLPSL